MMIELNCCDTCETGWLKLLLNCRNDARPPSVKPPKPTTASTEPSSAVST